MRICLATYHTPLQFQSKTTAKSGKWSKPAAVRRRWSGHGGPGGRCRSSRKAEQRGLQSIDKVTADVTALDSAARVARAVTYSLVCGAAHASADRLHARLQGRRQSDTGPAARCAARRWYQAWAPLRRPRVGQPRQPTGPGGVRQGAAQRRHVGGLEARSARPRPAPPGQSRPRTDRPRCRPEDPGVTTRFVQNRTLRGRQRPQFEGGQYFQTQLRSCLDWRIDAGGNARLFQLLYVPFLEVKFCAACAVWSKEHHPLECHPTTTGHVSISAWQRLRDSVHVLDRKRQKPVSFCSGWHASTPRN